MDNDTRTPKDRIKENLIRRLLELEDFNNIYSSTGNRTQSSGSGIAQGLNGDTDYRMNYGREQRQGASLAMVYSPMQEWQELYDAETALQKGTLFKELFMPFAPEECTGSFGSGGGQ